MKTIDIIESLVKQGDVFCADVICKDEKIDTLEILCLLEKYINLTK